MAKTGHTKKAKIKQAVSRGVYVEGAGKIPVKTIRTWGQNG